ncbi:MAG: tRNA (N6-threonylcarbamoyladenosine(37)-N6)-methyltransferase TrmO [Candidatus Omnitrophota bacterium]|mgnify:CR=1 FL=1|nr:MAG: tRNA (N6-threonylcarbamoyladenosine(37)-N6)-methyltransferase TrmO [Candidatus Omnitrophota bacterium]
MEKEIKLKPIGPIYTPYKNTPGIPIQGRFKKEATGRIEIFPEYQRGLKDVAGFSHLTLIYYFDRSKTESLVSIPYLESQQRGIFAIRSPHRPNHLGFSVVRVQKVEGSTITFLEVDMLDQTPLLDIKPYVTYFASRPGAKNGWLTRHLGKRNLSKRKNAGRGFVLES